MPPASGIEVSGEPGSKESLDFANYFVSYGYLYHQKDMLQDRGRMNAYRNAILNNGSCFAGKTVLDVGTGSGVLAIWAGMAGARRVYAVEATSMAQHARRLVQQNGMQDVVVVLEGYMEKIELPEKVDVILSEWMGYYLLREAMFDSVLAARDAWLKPGGAMFPSHAVLRMAPLCSLLYAQRVHEYEEECRTRRARPFSSPPSIHLSPLFFLLAYTQRRGRALANGWQTATASTSPASPSSSIASSTNTCCSLPSGASCASRR